MSEVKPISSEKPNYYQWGRNCAILKYTITETQKIIDSENWNSTNVSSEECDLFWEGYHYGLEN